MASVALNQDPLKTLGDGLKARSGGREWPMPLASTDVSVAEDGGIAVVRTTRAFRNAEAGPIEVTMTFPVPGDAILTGLRASIDGRELVATAQPSKRARQTYEDAIDSGKSAILHEEKLRGVHMLSLGNLGPGKEASVTVTFAVPLSFAGAVPTLRVPTTVGDVYGRSPLLPCDDLATGDVRHEATVAATSSTAVPQVLGLGSASGTVTLDRPLDLAFPGWAARPIEGRSAEGRGVTVQVQPLGCGDLPLDLTVLFDRSLSTRERIGGDAARRTVWDAMRDGLGSALRERLRDGDAVRLWQFNSTHRSLGEAAGAAGARLVDLIEPPADGTEIGVPLIAAAMEREGDILLVTDGRSHALDIQAVAALGRRVMVVLVGADALDAAVGHVAALTGGMTYVVAGDDVAGAVGAALGALRVASGAPESSDGAGLPGEAHVLRGGARIRLAWTTQESFGPLDDVGRFAAGLVLPTLTEEAATAVAVEHGLCTHLTSLVVVDEAGEAQAGIPATRKVPLMPSAFRSAGPMDVAYAAVPTHATSFHADPPVRSMMSSGGMLRSSRRSKGGDVVDMKWSSSMEGPGDFALLGGPGSFGPDHDDASTLESATPGPMRRRPSRPPTTPPGRGLPALPTDLGSPGLARTLDLRAAAARVDWDDVAPRVEAEGFGAFAPDIRLLLARIASLVEVKNLTKAVGMGAEAVACALLARAAGTSSRSAARLARRVLTGLPREAKALAAVGLAA